MGWQKRASGHSYSSRSDHDFVVGMHKKCIIDCIVYSMTCTTYEFKPKYNKGRRKVRTMTRKRENVRRMPKERGEEGGML